MLSHTRGAARRGAAPVALAVAVVLGVVVAALAAPTAALAIGTSGVDLTPQLPRGDDGSYVLTVADGEPPELVLTNVADGPRAARVYAATAELDGGGVTVGDAGSVPWLALDEQVELDAGEQRRIPVPVAPRRAGLAAGEDHFVALVLEVSPSESLVTQAVTIVRVRPGPVTPLPAWPAVVAIVLLATAVSALVQVRRRYARDAQVARP